MSGGVTTDRSFSAASAEADEWQSEIEGLVWIDGESVVIEGRHYVVHKSRCDTHAKILWWVKHLAGKPWVTPMMVDRFIEVSCEINKLPLPDHPGGARVLIRATSRRRPP